MLREESNIDTDNSASPPILDDCAKELLDAAPIAFYLLDKNLRVIEANTKGIQLLGKKSRAEVLNKNIIDIAPGIPPIHIHSYKQVLKTGIPKISLNIKAWPTAGGNKYINSMRFPVRDGLGIIVMDITDQYKLEREFKSNKIRLKELASAYVSSQENERELIACEVHDRVIQLLMRSCQLVENAKQDDTNSEKTRKSLTEINDIILKTIAECRLITKQLYPSVLSEGGFVSVITEELNALKPNGISTELITDKVDKISKPIAEVIYRIFHEAVWNAQRHSKASHIDVILKLVEDGVRLVVIDNGYGFNPYKVLQSGKFGGLKSMRRRAELMNGSFNIESELDKGTSIEAFIPFSVGYKNHA
ncbi:ATP-binding protein [Dehalococcoides mccartyi]|uniref:Sensor histidine kinase n=1 Tax=Dehalococcoides mccartyi TaxID=61435 RepID=A0A142VCA6_9CHLR|nr:ATP-binding protein [Dehalococcoides mccartyi]AMU87231.1 sensor histidine kinase [Dehalococcoides mccartyi]